MNRHRLQQDWVVAGQLARAVVAKRVTVLAGVGIVGGELVRDGVIPSGVVASGATHWAGVVISVLGVAGGIFWAQRGATPADPQLGPKDLYGNRLVSELSVGPHAGTGPGPTTQGDVSADAALEAAAAIHPMPPYTAEGAS